MGCPLQRVHILTEWRRSYVGGGKWRSAALLHILLLHKRNYFVSPSVLNFWYLSYREFQRRSGYEDVIFGCEYRNFDDFLKFCCAVSCFKMICNSGDQLEHSLSAATSQEDHVLLTCTRRSFHVNLHTKIILL